MNNKGIVYLGDCFELFEGIKEQSIEAVITDPPYFLDGMGDSWENDTVSRKNTKNQIVGSLKGGMKFSREQSYEFEKFMKKVAQKSFDVLKPGGWFISFSSPRLYHRLGVATEAAGFEIRDMWEWMYTQNQAKAMSVKRSILKDDSLSQKDKNNLIKELENWKTPQVKSCFEPIILAQKPREGTFYENWKKYGIGLVNVRPENDKFTANVITTENFTDQLDKFFLVGKPNKKEKMNSTHVSVKPIALMEHLVKVLVPENGKILDPFSGSGSTGIASLNLGRKYIGFEKNEVYYEESKERFNNQHKVTSTKNNFVIQ